MPSGVITIAYIVASGFFILSLGGLSSQESAKKGNQYGIIGMVIAVVATMFQDQFNSPFLLIFLMVAGGGIGAYVAQKVEMTAMPQLVAILHSFVGAAAVLVGIASHLEPSHVLVGAEKVIHDVEVILGVFIGAITFTGSVVAFGKLQGKIKSAPLLFPKRHQLNLAMCAACVFLGAIFLSGSSLSLTALIAITLIASVLGVLLVMAIGGADMPVVVSMLNSYSGWAAAAAGFMLSNDLLIVTGALVGSSGAILSYIMCKAMNRSIWNVIFGGFGAEAGTTSSAQGDGVQGTVSETSPEEVSTILATAKSVVIVPGYGMAVAQAQHIVHDLVENLRNHEVNVRFAVHPVAGRLPGHMNVLLAEAKVPYDIVLEMEEINDDFSETDVVLVIGANDIVNPCALDDSSSPIYGMPVLEVWKAKTTIMLKRGMASGYAGIDNPLYFLDNTRMLFGDARESLTSVVGQLPH